MCIKNLYKEQSKDNIPKFLQHKIELSEQLTGDSFFLNIFSSNSEVARVYYEEFYNKIFYKGKVNIRLKELIRLRLAGISGCKYCISIDENSAINNGLSEQDIINAKNNNLEQFTELESTILQLTNHIALSNAHERVNKNIIKSILDSLGQEQLIEILFVVALLSGMGQMLGSSDLVDTD